MKKKIRIPSTVLIIKLLCTSSVLKTLTLILKTKALSYILGWYFEIVVHLVGQGR